MSSTKRPQRGYDYRLQQLVQTSGDIELATEHGVPASTARGWLTTAGTEVVSIDVLDLDAIPLQHEMIQLRRRIRTLTAILRLVIVVFRVTGFSFSGIGIADGRDKQRLMRATIQRLVSQLFSWTVESRTATQRSMKWLNLEY